MGREGETKRGPSGNAVGIDGPELHARSTCAYPYVAPCPYCVPDDEWQPSEPFKGRDDDPILNGARWLKALREIRDQEWVENCLDPQWAARIAAEALRDA